MISQYYSIDLALVGTDTAVPVRPIDNAVTERKQRM